MTQDEMNRQADALIFSVGATFAIVGVICVYMSLAGKQPVPYWAMVAAMLLCFGAATLLGAGLFGKRARAATSIYCGMLIAPIGLGLLVAGQQGGVIGLLVGCISSLVSAYQPSWVSQYLDKRYGPLRAKTMLH